MFFALWKSRAVSDCCRLPAKQGNKLLLQCLPLKTHLLAQVLGKTICYFLCVPLEPFPVAAQFQFFPSLLNAHKSKEEIYGPTYLLNPVNSWTGQFLLTARKIALINITSCNFHSWRNTLFWPESYEKKSYFLCVPLEPFPIVAQLQFSSLNL